MINNNGHLGFDSPYQIRGGFSYRLPADVQFAGSIREATGLPQARTLRRDDDAGAGPDAGHAERQGRADRRLPLSVAEPRRPPALEVVQNGGTPASSRSVDVFNIFNNNAVTSAVTTIGRSLGRPSAIVMGRLFRVGGRISF